MAALLDVPAAAERLNISVRHLRELLYRREVPYLKVGRLVRFDPADLDAWLEARKIPAAPPRADVAAWVEGRTGVGRGAA
jgi:excisionase family DNA binding protein